MYLYGGTQLRRSFVVERHCRELSPLDLVPIHYIWSVMVLRFNRGVVVNL